MLSPEESQWYQEANRRNLLSPEEKSWYQEAEKRGLISKPDAPSGTLKGMRDPVDGAAQLLYNMLPESVQTTGNDFNNWLVDKGAPLDRIPEKGFNQMIKNDEQKYQQARTNAGETGMDWGRLGGNVISPANLLVATKAAQAGNALTKVAPMVKAGGLTSRMTGGAVAGGSQAAMMPISNGDFWNEKGKQSATGAAVGGLLPVATGAFSRLVKPKSSPQVQEMLKQGITPTPGQTIGGAVRSAEEKMGSLPIVGEAMATGQRRAIRQFNTAAYNRVLKNIGAKLPNNMQPGREAFNYVSDKISKEYDDLLPKLKGQLDKRFTNDINKILSMGKSLPEKEQKVLFNFVDENIKSKFTEYGKATGHTLKEIESKLGNEVRAFSASIDPYQKKLGGAYQEIQNSLRNMIRRNNPKYKDRLKNVNRAFAENLRIERAISSLGSDNGIFTPAQLENAVKTLSQQGSRKTQFAKGKALMQDLSSPAKEVLSTKYPDSGTTGRLLMGGMMAGGATGQLPASLGLLGATGAVYAPYVQGLLSRSLAARPAGAAPIASAIKKSSPYLAPGIIPAAYGLLNQ